MLWKSKKVLVTGGAGFIGSNLATRLCDLGADVEVLDMFSPYCGSNPQNLARIEKRIRIHRLDMATDALDNPVREQEFIFHLAGQIGHHFSHQKPEVDLAMNAILRILLA
jgi:nucleoside-diphosphate-sugar epimerase